MLLYIKNIFLPYSYHILTLFLPYSYPLLTLFLPYCYPYHCFYLQHTIVSCDQLRALHEVKVLRCLSSWFNLHCREWNELTHTCLMSFMLSIVANPRMPQR